MRVHRFFTPQFLHNGAQISLEEETSHHIHQVLRLKAGDDIILFNANGEEFDANLIQVNKKRVDAVIGRLLRHEAGSKLTIHLILGISRGTRMVFAMQKATELGVNRITPIFTERCVVKLNEKKSASRLSHWRHIIINACEQSGRCRIPVIDNPMEYGIALSNERSGKAILLDHRSQCTLNQITPPQTSLSILIGPEGGLTHKERQLAIQNGFIGIRLGPRVMRAETAPLAAIAAVQTLWGDFSD
ncbi:MAG: 16S rRNA (uracil(1498)-N(3))-methyltransferase [Candidatus Thiodiazotropha sp. (ex. Lucinisca nassula)]|nr:16S rRNA (uracil(1498)-N(3))-methyltransferase [Candidatus Thiodiazotropha sp. (ex. Lucinisca nassula)]MBW9274070.1 16S rRNA (uracil(1498)-N(3))-methyltransferase [Candidatus Thiodiazotropha sp. (ex. Lucinisca nassula)]PUB84365.1 MAG: 16S rRNA (uracil(1498)-N(3))-methyltransferase [gamma proteobacterium symbiont of Ctena orbiculata]PUB85967.1 MAG: 16S rRNA (uracil(1498)-N(3))-methyltransferase [gamma proteobacterium symbiont of Ctena orbiculata]